MNVKNNFEEKVFFFSLQEGHELTKVISLRFYMFFKKNKIEKKKNKKKETLTQNFRVSTCIYFSFFLMFIS